MELSKRLRLKLFIAGIFISLFLIGLAAKIYLLVRRYASNS